MDRSDDCLPLGCQKRKSGRPFPLRQRPESLLRLSQTIPRSIPLAVSLHMVRPPNEGMLLSKSLLWLFRKTFWAVRATLVVAALMGQVQDLPVAKIYL
jgi:hypothetical protein